MTGVASSVALFIIATMLRSAGPAQLGLMGALWYLCLRYGMNDGLLCPLKPGTQDRKA